MPPIRRDPGNEAELRFLRAHKRTRRIIECVFGMLKEMFPVLNYMRLQPEDVSVIATACAILYNMRRQLSKHTILHKTPRKKIYFSLIYLFCNSIYSA